ncbi:hypothetical protein INT44_001375 [Umbelopsis vinacea]|uniref:Uncharacterized protein n=1 Tax=Umbelopsis vinacea TaxID=44442 RepID=A0A8H7QAQ3_9FUNG|nr:hypothetical protein INT44_001375 [Umbelopsis vinacea]KAI9280895.1 hypothetical protein BC943DRAFT_363289 [Umbelopsis sp. AD052]
MPGPGTFFTLGAVGAAGAAAMFNRRNSSGTEQDNNTSNMTPHALGRRRSSADNDLSFSESRKMGEYNWRRHYGANFSHNSSKQFPKDTNMKS